MTARHQLSDIADVKIVKRVDPWSIGFAVGATALAVVAYQFIPWAGWRWAAFVLLVLLAAVCLACIHKHVVHLDLAQGPVKYDVTDAADEGCGFAVSLKATSQDARSAPGTRLEHPPASGATVRH